MAIMKKAFLVTTVISAVLAAPSIAAIHTLTAGVNDTSDPLVGVTDWTADIGFVASSLPASPNRVLFESGGDGTGIAITLMGNSLQVFQDQGDFNVSSPTGDTFFSVDVSSFANQTLSIRLDANLGGDVGEDTLQLDVFNGLSVLTSGVVTLPVNLTQSAGANDTGLGIVVGDIAGLDESGEAGFPDMAQFNSALYRAGGANALGEDVLAGILYTDQDPAGGIPAPGSWGLIPEPSSVLLLAFGSCLLLGRRKRAR